MSEFNQPAYPIGSGDMRDPCGLTIRQQAVLMMAAALATDKSYDTTKWPNNVAEDACKLADAVLDAEKETR